MFEQHNDTKKEQLVKQNIYNLLLKNGIKVQFAQSFLERDVIINREALKVIYSSNTEGNML